MLFCGDLGVFGVFYDTSADVAREFYSTTLELLIKRREKNINCDPWLVSKLKTEFPAVSYLELSDRVRK